VELSLIVFICGQGQCHVGRSISWTRSTRGGGGGGGSVAIEAPASGAAAHDERERTLQPVARSRMDGFGSQGRDHSDRRHQTGPPTSWDPALLAPGVASTGPESCRTSRTGARGAEPSWMFHGPDGKSHLLRGVNLDYSRPGGARPGFFTGAGPGNLLKRARCSTARHKLQRNRHGREGRKAIDGWFCDGTRSGPTVSHERKEKSWSRPTTRRPTFPGSAAT